MALKLKKDLATRRADASRDATLDAVESGRPGPPSPAAAPRSTKPQPNHTAKDTSDEEQEDAAFDPFFRSPNMAPGRVARESAAESPLQLMQRLQLEDDIQEPGPGAPTFASPAAAHGPSL